MKTPTWLIVAIALVTTTAPAIAGLAPTESDDVGPVDEDAGSPVGAMDAPDLTDEAPEPVTGLEPSPVPSREDVGFSAEDAEQMEEIFSEGVIDAETFRGMMEEEVVQARQEQAQSEDCEPHEPIVITEDEGPQGFVLGFDSVTGEPVYRPGSGVVGGSGTAEDPYVIEGWCIQAPYVGIVINGASAHVTVQNNLLEGPVDGTYEYGNWETEGSGFIADRAENVVVTDNFLHSLDVGVGVYGSSSIEVSGNTIIGTNRAIDVVDSPADGDGLLEIHENTLGANKVGITVQDSQGVQVVGNELDTHHYAIQDIRSERTSIEGNSIVWTTLIGILVESSDRPQVVGNSLSDIPHWTVSFQAPPGGSPDEGVNGGVFAQNTVEGNFDYWPYPVNSYASTSMTFTGNNMEVGFRLLDSDPLATPETMERTYLRHHFENNVVNGEPVRYISGQEDLEVTGTAGQIIVVDSQNVRLADVRVEGAGIGIQVLASENVQISNAHLEDNRFIGVYHRATNGSVIENSVFRNNGLSPSDFGGGSLASISVQRGDGVLLVRNNTIEGGGGAVRVGFALDGLQAEIHENVMEDPLYGVWLWEHSRGGLVTMDTSPTGSMTGNVIRESVLDAVLLRTWNGYTIRDNTIEATTNVTGSQTVFDVMVPDDAREGEEPLATQQPTYGFGVVVNFAVAIDVLNNTIRDNADSGIQAVTGVHNLTVAENVIESNGFHGFSQRTNGGTLVSHNTVLGNAVAGLSVPYRNNHPNDRLERLGVPPESVHIEQNDIRGNGVGIELYREHLAGYATTVNGNNIQGNGQGLVAPYLTAAYPSPHHADEALGPVDARENWWGCQEGPTPTGTLNGCDTVQGHVEYAPWLTAPNPDAGV